MAETPEFLIKFLKQIAIEQNFVNYKLKVTPISSGGANYTSILYDITFTEDGKDTYMFAKVAAAGDKMRTQAPKIYTSENYVYTKLSKIFQDLEDQHQVSQEHRLTFSKFYGFNTKKYEETIVLENLIKNGYETFDRFQCMSKEYAYTALRELAKFHALSYAYAKYEPEKFNRVTEDLKFEWGFDGGMMESVFKNSYGKAVATIKDELKGPLVNFFDSVSMKMLDEYVTVSEHPVIVHGDYRGNNLLHRIRDDGTVDIKIVDLQMMQSGSPILDLMYFIFTGSDEKFRAQYYEQLIDHYYTQLHAAMKRLHLDPENVFSRADFDNELKEKLPLGLVLSIIALPIVTVEEKDAPKVDKDMDISKITVEKTSDLYTQRLNGVVSDYVKWGILK